jgi:cathepsin F
LETQGSSKPTQCALICTPGENAACPQGATCQSIQGEGICTYATSSNAGDELAFVAKYAAEWAEFKTLYKKEGYTSDEEEAMRFAVFQKNMVRAEELTRLEEGRAQFGVTKFADMTPEEFKKMLGYKPISDTSKIESLDISEMIEAQRVNAPQKIDWTGNLTTAVKDQEQCGSCWAFSATEQIETMGIHAGKFGREQTLAVQQIVSCDRTDQGCNGGDTPTAYNSVMKAKGIEDGKKYPYTSGKGKNGACKFKDHLPVVTDISAFNYVGKKDETAMAAYLGQNAPLSICVDAESWQTYKSGLVGPKTCKTQLDHCVQVVGYDMTKSSYKYNYWKVRNSWNTDWGEKGFIYVSMGYNTCGIATEPTTVTISK